MSADRPLSGREHLLRLLGDIERIPRQPVGPHLDEEDLIGIAEGSLSDDRREEALEHIRSCAECAESAVNVPDVLEAAADAVKARKLRDRLGLVWMVATTAVWVARHQKGGIVRLSGSAAGQDRRPGAKFECAINENRSLRVRTRDEEWQGRPVHCLVYDRQTDRTVAEEWVMLFEKDDEGYTYGDAHLNHPLPESGEWGAEVRGYEAFDRLPPESVRILRRAYSRGRMRPKIRGLEVDEGQTWQGWLEREIAGGRLTPEQASAITGDQP